MISSKKGDGEKAKRQPVVLLVDDEPQILEALARHLRAEGFRVIGAPSAIHALQVLEKLHVDLVVADQRMPGPSGLRLLETVRDCWPEVGCVILTGAPGPELYSSPAVDLVLDKTDDAAFVIDTIVNEARQRNGEGR